MEVVFLKKLFFKFYSVYLLLGNLFNEKYFPIKKKFNLKIIYIFYFGLKTLLEN